LISAAASILSRAIIPETAQRHVHEEGSVSSSRRSSSGRSTGIHWLGALLWLALCAGAVAHEVPSSVVVTTLVRPEGASLDVVVRVPLAALRDVDWPRKGRGYLDLEVADPYLRDAALLWIRDELRFFENGRPLPPGRLGALRVSLPSDTAALAGFDTALAHLTGPPLPPGTELYVEQGVLDVLLHYDITSDRAAFAVASGFARLGVRTTTVLRFQPPEGAERLFQLAGDAGRVELDPRWHQAVGRFVGLGFVHVLEGLDHLLFLICLVIPFRRLKPLVVLVTAFTVAHSVTLTAAALGMAPNAGWFAPLVETLIAASIVYMAVENLFDPPLSRRWPMAFCFGLVHGFGFSFVLGDALQFAGTHLLLSLAAFNLGIEFGQLLVVAVAVMLLGWAARRGWLARGRILPQPLMLVVLTVLVAHTGWHWMLERGTELLAYPIEWAPPDAAGWAAIMRWLMLALAAGGLLWLLALAYRRWAGAEAVTPRV
jgi:hypothetical protein